MDEARTLTRYEIEVVLALAEELHFGRAGQQVGITTTRVSQGVRAIERRVGVPLFDRTSRRGHPHPDRPSAVRGPRAGV